MDKSVISDTKKVADKMRTLCSRREYCRTDILKKVLAFLDGNRNEAEAVVDNLVAEKYIDDLRYASAFARDKSSIAGWGVVKIRHMLLSKGIDRDTIEQALDVIDEDKAASKLDKIMADKARSLAGDPHIRLKLLRFGLGRGYAYDELAAVVDKLI